MSGCGGQLDDEHQRGTLSVTTAYNIDTHCLFCKKLLLLAGCLRHTHPCKRCSSHHKRRLAWANLLPSAMLHRT
jgi:hypothetical protein